jgi:tetratricopeptide (TPR) repeat protein
MGDAVIFNGSLLSDRIGARQYKLPPNPAAASRSVKLRLSKGGHLCQHRRGMSDRPLIFISAVSAEHRSLRTTVAALLDQEGYDTTTEEAIPTEQGDISEMLVRHLEKCDGVLQIVGQRYGLDKPAPAPGFGRCSYTQFEALHARSKGMKVWYILLDPAHPHDPCEPEVPELQTLQAAYRQRIQNDTHIYRTSSNEAETKVCIYEWRNRLEELREDWRKHMKRQEHLAADSHAMLQRLVNEVGKISKAAEAQGKTLADYTPEEVLAELARREGTTPAALRKLLDEALASDDLSTRAQALLIEQQFAQAAMLSRQAGDAKAKRLHAMQARTNTLAEEAAQDYRCEGLAHEYQFQFPQAIAAFERALNQITCATHPVTWGVLQNDLGVALEEQGIRTEPQIGNDLLARAVLAYRAALEVRSREVMPLDWAMTQHNMAVALEAQGLRCDGQRGVELLEQAVGAHLAALEVHTRSAFPSQWAGTQSSLAATLKNQANRTVGQTRRNILARAVHACDAALEVQTPETTPLDWAGTQNNLAGILYEIGMSFPGQAGLLLLVKARTGHCDALTVFTRETDPQSWAMTQNNLAAVLIELGTRCKGQVAIDLFSEAVIACRAAMDVRTREVLPQQWANTQNTLAIALCARGERTNGEAGLELLAQAVTAYRGALEVTIREASPQSWAMTQNNLALVLMEQGLRSDSADEVRLLAEAESACRAALEVYQRDSCPQDWAMVQNSLGNTLMAQGSCTELGKRRQRLFQQSEASFLSALEVYTRNDLPHAHQQTMENLLLVRAKMAK